MRKILLTLLLAVTFLGAGCGESTDIRFPVVDPPLAVNDGTYTVDEGQTLTVQAINGILVNDIVNDATISFDTVSAQGGAVNVNQEGGFTYTPFVGYTGPDSFTYTLDNGIGDSTATVTLDVLPVNGYFVDAANGDDTTGNFNGGLPFQTTQAAVTEAGPNQTIVVRPGTYNETVTLLDGQRLLGSGSALVNAQGDARPTFTGQITLANGNTVDYIRITGFTGDGIFSQDNTGGTITNCEITGLLNTFAINILSATGDWTVSNNNVSDNEGFAIRATAEIGDNFVGVFDNNVCTGNEDGSIGFNIGGNSIMKVQVTNNTMTGTLAPGGTFQVIAGDTANFCADITGNINDDAYQFGSVDATVTVQVEQLSQLSTINSGGAGVDVIAGSPTGPTEVPDGFCGF